MAFVAGAHAGAKLNGRVMGLTLAHAPMPQLPVKAPDPAPAAVAKR